MVRLFIDRPLAAQWAKVRRDQLDEGKIDALLAALASHAHASEAARKCFDSIRRNRQRMRYPEFRAQGLCVGSGVVEAGLSDRDRDPLQAGRHALDRRRRDHRTALLPAQWSV